MAEEGIKDPFTGNEFTEFRLEGKYLASPSTEAEAAPAIVLRCKIGEHGHASAKYDGKLEQAFLFVRTVVDAHVSYNSTTKVHIKYRLDDGKPHEEYLYPSTTYKALSLQPQYCGFCTVADLLYGHQLPHKEGSGPQVKKVLLSIPEYMGGDVVIQFDMPDATEVSSACGITAHK